MTVNVLLVTAEAVIFGCDSVSSAIEPRLDPFQFLEKTPEGAFAVDEQGRWTARFPLSALKHEVISTWQGVTKMFPICANGAQIAAMTSGLAHLNRRTIASYGKEFLSRCAGEKAASSWTVEQAAREFLGFVRRAYEQEFEQSQHPYTPELGFLVGGYGEKDHIGSAYRLDVKANTCECVADKTSTLAWAGQSTAVERILMGRDQALYRAVQKRAADLFVEYQEQVREVLAQAVQQIVESVGSNVEVDMATLLPVAPQFDLDWNSHVLDLHLSDMPVQAAVDLVSFLVNAESARSAYSGGVPTVAGRTRIGVIEQYTEFVMINEPLLQHSHVGFN